MNTIDELFGDFAVPEPTRLQQFFTPAWAAEALLGKWFSPLAGTDRVIDAGCGFGAFLNAVPSDVPAIGIEVDADCAKRARTHSGREVIVGDFRTVALPFSPTVVLGNPPFRRDVAEGFLARASEILPPGGRCGFILPASFLSFTSAMDRWRTEFSIAMELLPRDLFPRLSVPIAFYHFSKDSAFTLRGFALFDEAAELKEMPKRVRLMLAAGSPRQSVWRAAVSEILTLLGGRARLTEIYAVLEGRRPRPIPTWKDTVRRVLQGPGFVRLGVGEFANDIAAT